MPQDDHVYPNLRPIGMPPSPPDTDVSDDEEEVTEMTTKERQLAVDDSRKQRRNRQNEHGVLTFTANERENAVRSSSSSQSAMQVLTDTSNLGEVSATGISAIPFPAAPSGGGVGDTLELCAAHKEVTRSENDTDVSAPSTSDSSVTNNVTITDGTSKVAMIETTNAATSVPMDGQDVRSTPPLSSVEVAPQSPTSAASVLVSLREEASQLVSSSHDDDHQQRDTIEALPPVATSVPSLNSERARQTLRSQLDPMPPAVGPPEIGVQSFAQMEQGVPATTALKPAESVPSVRQCQPQELHQHSAAMVPSPLPPPPLTDPSPQAYRPLQPKTNSAVDSTIQPSATAIPQLSSAFAPPEKQVSHNMVPPSFLPPDQVNPSLVQTAAGGHAVVPGGVLPGTILSPPVIVQQQVHQQQPPLVVRSASVMSASGEQTQQLQPAMLSGSVSVAPASVGGRRAVHLRLIEEDTGPAPIARDGLGGAGKQRSFFFRRGRKERSSSESDRELGMTRSGSTGSLSALVRVGRGVIDRGEIVVSWYEGTTTTELQTHVRNSVIRKLGLKGMVELADVRIIDESVEPNEEIVLTPFIPDGSRFLLKFTTKVTKPPERPPPPEPRLSSFMSRAPDSPSAAPSPYQSSPDLAALNAAQLQMLVPALLQNNNGRVPRSGVVPEGPTPPATSTSVSPPNGGIKTPPRRDMDKSESKHEEVNNVAVRTAETEQLAAGRTAGNDDESDSSVSPDDLVEERLRQLNELLVLQRLNEKRGKDRRKVSKRMQRRHREEKKQVIFVLANYFVLFLSVIAISAEIQERAPGWMEWVERQTDNVQNCAADRDALFECVSRGDFAGLIASFVLVLTRSAATKQIFLFGFDTPKRLWTVVYESGVTAICWGTSYTFIRRGMNPDTRQNFLQKYWKDAVYGSLAGFNAAFMKAVLKNLIPQEVLGEALENRQLRLVTWVGQLFN